MVEYLIRFLAAYGTILLRDSIWLGIVAKNRNHDQPDKMMQPVTRWAAALNVAAMRRETPAWDPRGSSAADGIAA